MVPSVAQLSAQHLDLKRGVYQGHPTETPWQLDICVEQPLLRGEFDFLVGMWGYHPVFSLITKPLPRLPNPDEYLQIQEDIPGTHSASVRTRVNPPLSLRWSGISYTGTLVISSCLFYRLSSETR